MRGPNAPDGLSPEALYERARGELRRLFGYTDFRGVQPEAIRAVLGGRDVLVLMPTGGGKSLCYQIPALVLPGLALVVSPLISLMKDQVDALQRRGVPAAFINSTLGPAEVEARLERCARGEIKLLYVAPERFDSPDFRRRLDGFRVGLFAVDEAHCISEWGHDFRPSYLRLGAVRESLACPAIALTATATPAVREDILTHLALRRPVILAGGFDRKNLSWHVVAAKDEREKDRRLLQLLRQPRDGVAVVYAPTRKKVDALADMLNRAGLRAAGYHGGASTEDRYRLQEDFMRSRTPIIVATSAFGMGIDKPDVRIVIHHAMPATLESYYQEAGRGGRDGKPAECVLLHSYRDRFTHEFLIDQRQPPEDVARRVLEAMLRESGLRRHGPLRFSLRQLARTAEVERGPALVESALRALERAGALRVEESQRTRDPDVRVVVIQGDLADLPRVDWRLLRRGREREYAKLEWMQRYAYTRDCRRGFLLRYFGDPSAMRYCGACDRCLASREGPIPGSSPPRRGLSQSVAEVLRRLRR
jgi:ATP-dependent DNA helicase RecQ